MKMQRVILFVALVLCVLFLSLASAAGVDKQLYYQKKVDASPGTGPVSCTFSLYDAEQGGLLIWAETKDINMTSTTRLIATNLGDTIHFDTMTADLGADGLQQPDARRQGQAVCGALRPVERRERHRRDTGTKG
jgi:lipopolysaccharide export LptBFGC system permease protein LptF